MSLHMGVSKIDITPEMPVELSGFATAKRINKTHEHVLQRIYLRVFYFRYFTGAGVSSEALIVSADILAWGSDRIGSIRAEIAGRYGLQPTCVILNATHSHCGPQTISSFPIIGKADPDYLRFMEQRLFEAIGLAIDNQEPVRLSKGTGSCPIGVHRRKVINGRAVKLPNPDGPNDTEVSVIRIQRLSGETKGLLVHFTCHPSMTDMNELSGEYPGFAMEEAEQALGGAVCGFLQGCCGDIRADMVGENGRFFLGNASHLREAGKRLAQEIQQVLQGEMAPLEACPIVAGRSLVPIAYACLPTSEELASAALESDEKKRWAKFLNDHPDRFKAGEVLDIVYVKLSEDLSLIAANGELSVEYGLWVKQETGNRTLPLGYSNGMIGYVPTANQVHEGGYEGIDAIYLLGTPAPYEDNLEQKIKDRMASLLQV